MGKPWPRGQKGLVQVTQQVRAGIRALLTSFRKLKRLLVSGTRAVLSSVVATSHICY